jgi:putative ABC transport system permease protein
MIQLKLALRVLNRRKVFTAISLVGITLTLVVLVIVSTIMDNTFAPGAPESRLDRILAVKTVGEYGPDSSGTSNPGYGFLSRTVYNLPHADHVAIYAGLAAGVIYEGTRRIEAHLKHVDGEYWNILDFHFIEGGPFSIADNSNDRGVIVISETLRDKVFGNRRVVGKLLNVAGRMYQIVGVVSPVVITREAPYSQMWAPIGTINSEERTALMGRFNALVLAHSRADIRAMQREFQTRVKRVPVEDPKEYTEVRSGLDTSFESEARSITSNQLGDRGPIVVRAIMAAVALLFMLLPALNLITLNLSRILERAPEIGVRKAFGAPRSALVMQFVMENVVLTLIGGVIAFILAVVVLRSMAGSVPYLDRNLIINVRVFGYGMLAALVFGILSGAYPAWRMSRLEPVNALRGGSL